MSAPCVGVRVRDWEDRRHYSWAECLATLAHGEPTAWKSTCTSRAQSASTHWDLKLGYERAVALAAGTEAWEDGRARIESIAREQAERFIAKRPFRDYSYEVVGEFFDVPSVLEGRPECWMLPQQANTGSPALVRLVVDLGTSGGVGAHVMERRMVAVAATALTLEACGNPVEVIAASSSQGAGSYLLSYQVSVAGEPLDVSRLVALAHPAFFRRCVFRLIELTPSSEVHRVHHYGYGDCPREIPADVLAQEFGTHVAYVPPCPLYERDVPTAKTLLHMVKQRAGMVGTDDATVDDEWLGESEVE